MAEGNVCSDPAGIAQGKSPCHKLFLAAVPNHRQHLFKASCVCFTHHSCLKQTQSGGGGGETFFGTWKLQNACKTKLKDLIKIVSPNRGPESRCGEDRTLHCSNAAGAQRNATRPRYQMVKHQRDTFANMAFSWSLSSYANCLRRWSPPLFLMPQKLPAEPHRPMEFKHANELAGEERGLVEVTIM